MKVVSILEMQRIEKEADASGNTYEKMMEQAGSNLAQAIEKNFSHLKDGGVFGLVGKGNNGGDTLVALDILAKQGWLSTAYLVAGRKKSDALIDRLKKAGGKILDLSNDIAFQDLINCLENHAVMLDGVFGTGVKLPLRGKISDVLNFINNYLTKLETPPVIVAVDCPSGMNCDSGEVAEETLAADLTVSMAAAKAGFFSFPAFEYIGDLKVVGIGLEDDMPGWAAVDRFVVDDDFVESLLPERPLDAHKGTFGTAMVVAGSVNYTGAAYLAGKAAYRVGAGLVTLAVPGPLHGVLAGQIPEATWLLLPHELGVIDGTAAGIVMKNLEKVSAILVGPGLGLEEATEEFLKQLLHPGELKGISAIGFVKPDKSKQPGNDYSLPPAVFDADGLKLLTKLNDWDTYLPKMSILTPHPGEMSVLTGISKKVIQYNRIGIAEEYAKKWGHVVVLKGAFTVVAAPTGKTAIIPIATPALARAGTGDVLAGVIVGLRAQGLNAFEAAAAGAWIHAQAGLVAEDVLGNSASVLAGDVLEALVNVLGDLSD